MKKLNTYDVIYNHDVSVPFNDIVWNKKKNGDIRYSKLALPNNMYTHIQACNFNGNTRYYINQVDDNVDIVINLN